MMEVFVLIVLFVMDVLYVLIEIGMFSLFVICFMVGIICDIFLLVDMSDVLGFVDFLLIFMMCVFFLVIFVVWRSVFFVLLYLLLLEKEFGVIFNIFIMSVFFL